jgi:hypothetical protein
MYLSHRGNTTRCCSKAQHKAKRAPRTSAADVKEAGTMEQVEQQRPLNTNAQNKLSIDI